MVFCRGERFSGVIRRGMALLALTVSGVSLAQPVAVNDQFDMSEDGAQLVGDVKLDNGSGPDDPGAAPSSWALIDDATDGTLVFAADGTFTYDPDANFSGIDTFTYRVTDSNLAIDGPTTVTINVDPAPDC